VVTRLVRKYYRITTTGRRVLAQLQQKIRELTNEVLEEPVRREAAGKRASK
jgi:DNA-binding PadR family transcriptional regulator